MIDQKSRWRYKYPPVLTDRAKHHVGRSWSRYRVRPAMDENILKGLDLKLKTVKGACSSDRKEPVLQEHLAV